MAVRLDGAAIARELRAGHASRVERLAAGGVRPGLAVILVGADPASQVYVRSKAQACEAIGMRSDQFLFAADAPHAAVLDRIDALNADPQIHGILVQLPLPPQLDEARIFEAIAPEKDIDGFHRDNLGALSQGQPRFVPCTPRGVIAMLDHAGVDLRGKDAVAVGRSNIVGKPMAQLLMARDATVTVCPSRTADLAVHTRRADVLVVAAGRPRMLTQSMVKSGAIVVDVGIHRDAEGRLCGDVDYEGCRSVASLISPVPGGVGPMTITMLLANTLDAAERRAARACRQVGCPGGISDRQVRIDEQDERRAGEVGNRNQVLRVSSMSTAMQCRRRFCRAALFAAWLHCGGARRCARHAVAVLRAAADGQLRARCAISPPTTTRSNSSSPAPSTSTSAQRPTSRSS